jgi:hypothetical protein
MRGVGKIETLKRDNGQASKRQGWRSQVVNTSKGKVQAEGQGSHIGSGKKKPSMLHYVLLLFLSMLRYRGAQPANFSCVRGGQSVLK